MFIIQVDITPDGVSETMHWCSPIHLSGTGHKPIRGQVIAHPHLIVGATSEQ